MTTFILSFFLTSLIMSALILFIWIIHSLAANVFTAKLRYITWVVILIGFLIPLRFSIGYGVINLPPVYQTVAPAYQGSPADEMATLDNQENIINEQPLDLETNEAPPDTNEQAVVNNEVPDDGNGIVNVQNPNVTTAETNMAATIANFFTAFTLLHVILIIWAIGVVGILTYHIIQYIKFHRQVKRWGEQEEDEETWEAFHNVVDDMGLAHKKINLMTCPFITSSMLTGLFKPVILLPERNFDQDELTLIFKHELVHYKRHDLLVKFLSLIAIAIHWYNPFIYLLSGQMQAEGEASCDEHVLKDVDLKNRHFYAEVIIGMIGKKNKMTFLATNFYGGKLGIKKRLTSVMDTKRKLPIISYGLLILVLCVIFFSGSVFATTNYESSYIQQTSEPSIYEPIQPTANITAAEAVELAIELIGGGDLISLELSIYEGNEVYVIEIDFEDFLYSVLVDIQTENIISLSSTHLSEIAAELDSQPAQSTTSTSPPETVSTDSSNGSTISRDRAAEIALALVPGTLIEVDNDFEHGRAVWYVEIRSGRHIHEIYVDQQTGEIVYHESEIDD